MNYQTQNLINAFRDLKALKDFASFASDGPLSSFRNDLAAQLIEDKSLYGRAAVRDELLSGGYRRAFARYLGITE